MLGLSLWEGRLPGQKTIENEDKAAMGSYRPESNFGTSDTVTVCVCLCVCTMIVLRMCAYIRSLFCVLKGHVSTPLGPLRRPL